MRNDEKSARVCGIVAVSLSFPTWLLTFIAGIAMFFTYATINCGIFTLLISALLLASAITGAVSLQKSSCALASSIMSAISAVVIICCAAMPFNNPVALGLAISAGLLSIALFALYAVYFTNSPRQIKYDVRELQYKSDMLLIKINHNSKRFQEGSICEDEFQTVDAALNAERNKYLDLIRNPHYKKYGKKQVLTMFLVPALIMLVLFSTVIPCTVVGTYNRAYNVILDRMAHMSDSEFRCGGAHSDMRYVYLMPESYKDVAKIRAEYDYVKKQLDYIYDWGNSKFARQAYLNLKELEKQDSRWNFKNMHPLSVNVLLDATWSDGDMQITFFEASNDNKNMFATNLPIEIPETSKEEVENARYTQYIEEGCSTSCGFVSSRSCYFEIGLRLNEIGVRIPICQIVDLKIDGDGVFTIKAYCLADGETYTLTLVA